MSGWVRFGSERTREDVIAGRRRRSNDCAKKFAKATEPRVRLRVDSTMNVYRRAVDRVRFRAPRQARCRNRLRTVYISSCVSRTLADSRGPNVSTSFSTSFPSERRIP